MKPFNYQPYLLIMLLSVSFIPECFAESGVYVGGHFRRERPGTIVKLKASGFTYAILFNVNVEEEGSLTVDGDTICTNGKYVFAQKHPYYANDVASLKQGVTNITRIEICIGGWNNQSWFRVKSLIGTQGVGSNSILYKNFQALKAAVPAIDAINNDDEHAYDVTSATAFHVMMYDIGYYSTIAPYRQKNYWQALVNNVNGQRPGALYRVYIQCYDGGAGNNPRDWHLGGLPLHAGRLNYQDFNVSINAMASWKAEQGVSGGFFWVYDDETWDMNRYAMAVNRIFHVTENPVATFYSSANFSGHAVSLSVGEYVKTQLMYYGIPDNNIASIKISHGYKAIVYVNDNFSGSQKICTSDNAELETIISRRISSLKIEQDGNALESRTMPVHCFYDAGLEVISIESDISDYYKIVDISGMVKDEGFLQARTNLIDVSKFNKGIYFIKTKSRSSVVKIFLY